MQHLVDEALRYMGVRALAGEELRSQLESLACEISSQFKPQSTWRMFPTQHNEHGILLGNIHLTGRSAASMLAECDRCAVMVCTLGAGFDAWLRRMQARDMTRAVMLDALGSAFVEEICDKTEQEITKRFPEHYLTDRFSPGYGDLPLALQHRLLSAAEAHRIGVHATDACMLTPQKSVTALIGIAATPQAARIRGCAHCSMNKTCTIRKAGMTCDL